VVEAAAQSGSLITARMALEQNREVFAVPGSPLDPRAEGTNSLLRDGAHMATNANDIISVLKSLRMEPLREPSRSYTPPPMGDSPEPSQQLRNRILESLSPTPVEMDELIRSLEAPIGEVLTIILELELAGRIERQAGNRVNLI
jgi:DNA processing protein